MNNNNNISGWWADNPMTYGVTHGRTEYERHNTELGTREAFETMDRVLFEWNRPLHEHYPFDRIFPYSRASRSNGNVLEVGCGLGCMSSLWARRGIDISAVDLNPVSIEQTKRRFELFELDGYIQQADARRLPFTNDTFDFVYSWGVLHHSPDLEHSVNEILRVLKPGGWLGLMLYNRNSILYRYMIRYLQGFLHYENRFLQPLQLASRYSDGYAEEGNPHTWPVTQAEMKNMLSFSFRDINIRVLGTDLPGILRIALPGLGTVLPVWSIKPWARRFGWSLWITATKR